MVAGYMASKPNQVCKSAESWWLVTWPPKQTKSVRVLNHGGWLFGLQTKPKSVRVLNHGCWLYDLQTKPSL